MATYYLDEAAWEHEDIDLDHLEAAARTVAAKVERAGELVGAPPPAEELRLEPGPACGWCTRSEMCPVSIADVD